MQHPSEMPQMKISNMCLGMHCTWIRPVTESGSRVYPVLVVAAQFRPVSQALCCVRNGEGRKIGKQAHDKNTSAPHVLSTGVYEGIRALTRKLRASVLWGCTQVPRLVPIQPCNKAALSTQAGTALHAAHKTVSTLWCSICSWQVQ